MEKEGREGKRREEGGTEDSGEGGGEGMREGGRKK